MHKLICVAALLYASLMHTALAQELVSTRAEQKALAVTIYNDQLALIKDTRSVNLPKDETRLAWREVSAKMRAETALLRNLSHPEGFRLIEQNFDFDLLTPQKLLDKYLGKEVSVIRTHPTSGVETRETATVLSTQNGVVLKFADRIETGLPGRLAYPSVPDNLRDLPTLIITLQSKQAGAQDLELSYLTGGLSWRADYVAELNASDSALDLNGWVTLTNQSGARYDNARLQLVAGDVNRVRDLPAAAPRVAMAKMQDMAVASEMQQESLFEYHLYTLPRPTTLADHQTKQVALLSASAVPVRKEFLLQGADYYYHSPAGDIGRKLKVGVFVEFKNDKAQGLGVPLPKGVMRVYKKDAAGNAQFIGEDRIDHTPVNETVRLKLGDAFDITADKKQTDFQKLPGSGRYNAIYESAFEIVLKNAKKDAVTVTVREPIPGDWSMQSESQPHKKVSSQLAEWQVQVPAEGEAKLSYRVRVSY